MRENDDMSIEKLPKWLEKLWSTVDKDTEEKIFSHSAVNEQMVKILAGKLRFRGLSDGKT